MNENSVQLKLLEMAMTSDDQKIRALGESIDMLAQIEKFTSYELVTCCSTLIVGAIVEEGKKSGKDVAIAFKDTIIRTLKKTIEVAISEEFDDCENEDSSN